MIDGNLPGSNNSKNAENMLKMITDELKSNVTIEGNTEPNNGFLEYLQSLLKKNAQINSTPAISHEESDSAETYPCENFICHVFKDETLQHIQKAVFEFQQEINTDVLKECATSFTKPVVTISFTATTIEDLDKAEEVIKSFEVNKDSTFILNIDIGFLPAHLGNSNDNQNRINDTLSTLQHPDNAADAKKKLAELRSLLPLPQQELSRKNSISLEPNKDNFAPVVANTPTSASKPLQKSSTPLELKTLVTNFTNGVLRKAVENVTSQYLTSNLLKNHTQHALTNTSQKPTAANEDDNLTKNPNISTTNPVGKRQTPDQNEPHTEHENPKNLSEEAPITKTVNSSSNPEKIKPLAGEVEVVDTSLTSALSELRSPTNTVNSASSKLLNAYTQPTITVPTHENPSSHNTDNTNKLGKTQSALHEGLTNEEKPVGNSTSSRNEPQDEQEVLKAIKEYADYLESLQKPSKGFESEVRTAINNGVLNTDEVESMLTMSLIDQSGESQTKVSQESAMLAKLNSISSPKDVRGNRNNGVTVAASYPLLQDFFQNFSLLKHKVKEHRILQSSEAESINEALGKVQQQQNSLMASLTDVLINPESNASKTEATSPASQNSTALTSSNRGNFPQKRKDSREKEVKELQQLNKEIEKILDELQKFSLTEDTKTVINKVLPFIYAGKILEQSADSADNTIAPEYNEFIKLIATIQSTPTARKPESWLSGIIDQIKIFSPKDNHHNDDYPHQELLDLLIRINQLLQQAVRSKENSTFLQESPPLLTRTQSADNLLKEPNPTDSQSLKRSQSAPSLIPQHTNDTRNEQPQVPPPSTQNHHPETKLGNDDPNTTTVQNGSTSTEAETPNNPATVSGPTNRQQNHPPTTCDDTRTHNLYAVKFKRHNPEEESRAKTYAQVKIPSLETLGRLKSYNIPIDDKLKQWANAQIAILKQPPISLSDQGSDAQVSSKKAATKRKMTPVNEKLQSIIRQVKDEESSININELNGNISGLKPQYPGLQTYDDWLQSQNNAEKTAIIIQGEITQGLTDSSSYRSPTSNIAHANSSRSNKSQ